MEREEDREDDFVVERVLETLGDLNLEREEDLREFEIEGLFRVCVRESDLRDGELDFDRERDLLFESKTYSPFLFCRIFNRLFDLLKLGSEETYRLVDREDDRLLDGDEDLKSNTEFLDFEDDFLNFGGARTNFPSTLTIASFARLVYLGTTFGLEDFFLEIFFFGTKDRSLGGFRVDFFERVCIFRGFFFNLKEKKKKKNFFFSSVFYK